MVTGTVILLSACTLVGVRLRKLRARIYHPASLWPAHMAERLAPQLGTSLTSAVAFAQQLAATGDVQFSAQLAEAHISSTAGALADIDFIAQLRRRRRKPRRRLNLALLASLWVTLLLFALLPTARARLRSFLTDPQGARLSDVPLAGDIHLSYRYPAYTQLPGREVQGSDGSIQAVVGTEVELTCTSDMPVQSAILRVETPQGAEPQDVPMTVQNSRSLGGTLGDCA